jgi:NADPH:quinone reductase-like Zn-dependent oxidoreductase
MKAIVYTKSGLPKEALKQMDIEKPVPKENQILVKVTAAAMNFADYKRFMPVLKTGKISFSDKMMDFFLKAKNNPLGSDIAGIVEKTGKNVTNFKTGDEVFGVTVGIKGAWAEYALANEANLALKPASISFEQAAALPTVAITALAAIHKADVKNGQQVLVYGASGGVGQFIVQLAKAFGATVTGVCSTRNVETVRNIGADFVIDYKTTDFSEQEQKYDVIFGVNGYNSIIKYKKTLNNGGIYVAIGGDMKQIFELLLSPFIAIGKGKKFTFSTYFTEVKKQPLIYLNNLIEEGKIAPNIEKICSLQEVPEVVENLAKNHAQGKIVIKI